MSEVKNVSEYQLESSMIPEILAMVNQTEFDTSALVEMFAKASDSLKKLYAADTRVWESTAESPITIGMHTIKVIRQFEEQIRSENWESGVLSKAEFRLMLALHDIGKPLGKSNKDQHIYTEPIMREVLSQFSINPAKIEIMVGIACSSIFGSYFRDSIDEDTAAARFKTMSDKLHISVEELLPLMMHYYIADAGTYTKFAGGTESLDYIFVYKNRKLMLAPHFLHKVDRLLFSLLHEMRFSDVIIGADTVDETQYHGTQNLNPLDFDREDGINNNLVQVGSSGSKVGLGLYLTSKISEARGIANISDALYEESIQRVIAIHFKGKFLDLRTPDQLSNGIISPDLAKEWYNFFLANRQFIAERIQKHTQDLLLQIEGNEYLQAYEEHLLRFIQRVSSDNPRYRAARYTDDMDMHIPSMKMFDITKRVGFEGKTEKEKAQLMAKRKGKMLNDMYDMDRNGDIWDMLAVQLNQDPNLYYLISPLWTAFVREVLHLDGVRYIDDRDLWKRSPTHTVIMNLRAIQDYHESTDN